MAVAFGWVVDEAVPDALHLHHVVLFVGGPGGEPKVGHDHAGLGAEEHDGHGDAGQNSEEATAACEVHEVGLPGH